MKVIKKYANRKYYDTEISKYISLQDIHSMVLADTLFIVIENDTKQDITAQVILDVTYLVNKSNELDVSILKNIIKAKGVKAYVNSLTAKV